MLWSCKPSAATYGKELPVSTDWENAGEALE
jgi:hypothetical protein